MLRLCRGRKSDPAFTHESRRAQDLQGRCEPKLEEELLHLDPMALAEHVLDYDERVALLARDPVACSDGFDVLVLLTLKHLFGVRYCPDCPNCAKSHRPCTDVFGSNATAMGGIFGRIDAVYGSIECQKSGTRHGHFQLFLQCRHHPPRSRSYCNDGHNTFKACWPSARHIRPTSSVRCIQIQVLGKKRFGRSWKRNGQNTGTPP